MTNFPRQILIRHFERLIAAGLISGAFAAWKLSRSQRLVQPGVAA